MARAPSPRPWPPGHRRGDRPDASPLAAALVEVVGHGGGAEQIDRVTRLLAAIPERRALLVCLYLPLGTRDPVQAGEVLKHLDDAGLAKAIETAARGGIGLRRNALHRLGSSRVTDEILRRHKDLFESRPRRSAERLASRRGAAFVTPSGSRGRALDGRHQTTAPRE